MDRRTVAVIGAECSGKSTLCLALARSLPGAFVPESLRLFVEEYGRVPGRGEQAALMQRQIDAAAAAPAGWVLSDGGALMTAVYSLMYYDDASLVQPAVDYHRRCRATVWCGTGIPWQPDAGQREGPAHRRRAHELIGRIVAEQDLPVLRVDGPLPQRVAAVRRELLGRQ